MTRFSLLLAVVMIALFGGRLPARAHPLAPASLIVEQGTDGGTHQITVRCSKAGAAVIHAVVPDGCQTVRLVRSDESIEIVREDLTVRCLGSLEGSTVVLEGLWVARTGAIAYARFLNGHEARAVLTPDDPRFLIPAAQTRGQVFVDYLRLGVGHLLTGADHIAFVLCLALLVRRFRRLAWTLTAFTLGHSVTLCLAALDLIHLPSAPVEFGIALSIVVLALEVLAFERPTQDRVTFAMAAGFGLLHGLGFAGALREVGLKNHAIALSLFSFNLGVELGQMAIVAVTLPLLVWVSASERRVRLARSVFGVGVGAVSAFWCIERAVGIF